MGAKLEWCHWTRPNDHVWGEWVRERWKPEIETRACLRCREVQVRHYLADRRSWEVEGVAYAFKK